MLGQAMRHWVRRRVRSWGRTWFRLRLG